MKRLFILIAFAFLSTGALQAQWRELHTGVTENLYDVCCVDTNTVFVCGQNGVILKTVDGGDTWQELYRQEGRELCKIAFFDQNVGYAGGNDGVNNGVLMRTTDGGETWEDVNNTIVFKNDYQDLVKSYHIYNNAYDDLFSCHMGLYPVSTDTLLIYHSDKLYKSTDGGMNFVTQVFNGFINAAYFNGDVGFVVLCILDVNEFEFEYDVQIVINKTIDGGETWTEISSYQGVGSFYAIEYYSEHDNHVAAFFTNKENATIYTHSKIIRTTDGFQTSEEQTNQFWMASFIGSFDMTFFYEKYGCALSNFELDKGNTYHVCAAWITCDGGLTWENKSGLPGTYYYLYSVASAPDTCFYISTGDGLVYKYGVNMPIQGLNEQENDTEFVNIFPNPTHENVTIEGKEINKVEIYDMVGREVVSQTYNSKDKMEIDLFDMQDGIYIIKVYDKNGCNELKINKIK